jgi:hypothetical protein
MVRKPVRRGPRAGLEMWGCRRWPDCDGVINIDPEPRLDPGDEIPLSVRTGVPAGYAQARFERVRRRARLKRQAALPLVTASSVLVMGMVFFGAQAFGVPIASVAAVLSGAVFSVALFRLPFESLVWAKGIEGERKTAAYLQPLLDNGFVVLYNRQIPGSKGDIDSLVIGPTGVFPIETKNWSGRVEIRNDRLFVGNYDRTWVIQQVYREALAVQVALGDELTTQRVTVAPVICAIGGVAWFERAISGVHVTDGKHLARVIADRPTVFDDDTVQRIAGLADRRLRLRQAWEDE